MPRNRDIPPHLVADTHSPSPSSPQPPIQTTEMDGEAFDGGDENIFRDMTFDEVLEDLNARFLVNLPKEEMSLVRVYWQAEQAHWFYEDYLRPLNPLLPSLSQKHFTHLIIASSPLYTGLTSDGNEIDYNGVWEEYCSYKRMVPVCGGILVNRAGNKVLMVRGWKSNAGWCFPRGKINSEEDEADCAIREVEEETGFDLTGRIVPKDKIQTQVNAQNVTMFIVGGIEEDTVFETQTRNEIGAIEWVPVTDLPTWTGKRGPKTTGGKGQKKFYNVTPFVGPLKRWLAEHGFRNQPKSKSKKTEAQNSSSQHRNLEPFQFDESPLPAPQPIQPRPPTAAPHQHSHSALDSLFTKFVHVQQEDLRTDKHVGGESTKDGLERLFGNLAMQAREPINKKFGSDPSSAQSEEDRIKEEDRALAALLGGSVSPAPIVPSAQPKGTGSAKLLAVLNQTAHKAVPASSAHRHSESFASSPPAATTVSVKPHQASLLAMLGSPAGPTPAVSDSSTRSAVIQGHHINRSAKSASPKTVSSGTSDEEERRRRNQALLEMTVAGIGSDPLASVKSSKHSSQRSGADPPSQQSPPSHPFEHGNNDVNSPRHSTGSGTGTGKYSPPTRYLSGAYGNEETLSLNKDRLDILQRSLPPSTSPNKTAQTEPQPVVSSYQTRQPDFADIHLGYPARPPPNQMPFAHGQLPSQQNQFMPPPSIPFAGPGAIPPLPMHAHYPPGVYHPHMHPAGPAAVGQHKFPPRPPSFPLQPYLPVNTGQPSLSSMPTPPRLDMSGQRPPAHTRPSGPPGRVGQSGFIPQHPQAPPPPPPHVHVQSQGRPIPQGSQLPQAGPSHTRSNQSMSQFNTGPSTSNPAQPSGSVHSDRHQHPQPPQTMHQPDNTRSNQSSPPQSTLTGKIQFIPEPITFAPAGPHPPPNQGQPHHGPPSNVGALPAPTVPSNFPGRYQQNQFLTPPSHVQSENHLNQNGTAWGPNSTIPNHTAHHSGQVQPSSGPHLNADLSASVNTLTNTALSQMHQPAPRGGAGQAGLLALLNEGRR